MYIYLLIIYIIALLFAVIYFKNYYIKETFDNQIYYMSGNETSKFLLEDKDNYIRNMSYSDLYARNVRSYNVYFKKIQNISVSFTDKEIDFLNKLTKRADNFLYNYNGYYSNLINGKDISKIKWKFALTNNLGYEQGYPHTRENIIFLSREMLNIDDNNDDLINTIIHEKVHIYQRQNKVLMDKILKILGYTEYPIEKINKDILIRRRANPDITDTIYLNPILNKEMIFYYNSLYPSGINDIQSSDYLSEHPYEKMAYEIGNEYIKQQTNKYINNI